MSQDVSSKPLCPTHLTQAEMTEDLGLETWESFSGLAEGESDYSFSLARGEAGKGDFGLDVLRHQPSQRTLRHVDASLDWEQTAAAARSQEAVGGSYSWATECVLPLVTGHISS